MAHLACVKLGYCNKKEKQKDTNHYVKEVTASHVLCSTIHNSQDENHPMCQATDKEMWQNEHSRTLVVSL
jgi:hypothetical protein